MKQCPKCKNTNIPDECQYCVCGYKFDPLGSMDVPDIFKDIFSGFNDRKEHDGKEDMGVQ
jgi:hypothetical protein